MSDPRVTDEAVEAAEREYETFGATMKDALEAALPHLAPRVVDQKQIDVVLRKHQMQYAYGRDAACLCGQQFSWVWQADHRKHVADALLALLNGGVS